MSEAVLERTQRQSTTRVVRVIARLNVGGPTRHVVWLASGLRERSYDTILVTGRVPPGEVGMEHFATERGVDPLVFSELSREINWKDMISVWKLYRLLVQVKPDILHTHTAKAGTVGRLAGLLYRYLTPGMLLGKPRRCRFVHTYHGHVFHSYYGKLKTWVFLTIERMLALLATDRIVVLSPQQYNEIHQSFRVGRPEQFAVISLGLDLDVFSNWENRRQLLRDELGLAETDKFVVIVGRLTEVKNHGLFLRAASLFREHHRPQTGRVRFGIIGDGHMRAPLEAEAAALGLQEEVIFLGMRDDPEIFYPAADLVALTSHNEGTPLTLIEAMANGRPVVATAVGGVVDLLGNTRSPSEGTETAYQICARGIRVSPDDAESFAKALARLLKDDLLADELGQCGEEYVRKYFAKERLIDDIDSLYLQLLSIGVDLTDRKHTEASCS